MNESLNNRQIAFYIFGVTTGYGIISLPKEMSEAAGTSGWLLLSVTTIAVAIVACIVLKLGLIFKNMTMFDYGKLLVGKYISTMIIGIYLILYFIIVSMATRVTLDIVRESLLPNTPIWAFCLLFFTVIYYGISKGLNTIARICELYGVFIFLFIVFIHALMLTEGSMINLRPFIEPYSILEYIKAMPVTLVPLFGFEALMLVPLGNKNNERVLAYSAITIVIIGLLYVLIVESCLSIMGVDVIVYFNDATLASIRRLNLPYLDFLKRLDGLFMLALLMALFNTIAILSYTCTFVISKWIKKINFKIIALFVNVAAFIAAIMPSNYVEAAQIIKSVIYVIILTSFIIPLTFLIIAKIKKYDKKVNKS